MTQSAIKILNGIIGIIALLSFIILFQNYGINILPPEKIVLSSQNISTLPGDKSYAYVYKFTHSEPDVLWKPRSQIQLQENNNS